MSTAEQLMRMTEEEYLAFDRAAVGVKHEYFNGEVHAMSGGGFRHSVIASNVGRVLGNQLTGKPCQVTQSDMRLKINETKAYVYPDVMVVCGKPALLGKADDLLTNPTVIVEVLSPSTALHDKQAKFAHYRKMPSVQDILFVDSQSLSVEAYRRSPGETWLLTAHDTRETVVQLSLDVGLPMAELYEGIDFEATADGDVG